jgi:hypothetical protein
MERKYGCHKMSLKIVIEEYTPPKLAKNAKKKFFLPPIPWQWTLYDGLKVVSFGYCHTEEDAEVMANSAIRDMRKV